MIAGSLCASVPFPTKDIGGGGGGRNYFGEKKATVKTTGGGGQIRSML